MGFGWQEIDKTLDLGYIRVAGLHRECKPAVGFDPPNLRPRTMTHVVLWFVCDSGCTVCTMYTYKCVLFSTTVEPSNEGHFGDNSNLTDLFFVERFSPLGGHNVL